MNVDLPVETLVGFSLALVRTVAWVTTCPPFNGPAVPVRVRVGFATAVSFVLAPMMAGQVTSLELGPFVLALLMQALAGIALGFAVNMLFSAIQAAGDLIDLQVGFSLGAVLDPISGATAAPFGRFHQLMATVILFAINGHVLVVRGFLRSVEMVPDASIDLGVLASELTELLGVLMIAALEVGLPVLAALFCTEVALGLLGKVAPQLNILVLGFALKTAVALSMLTLTLALLPSSTETLVEQAVRAVGRAFGGS